MKRNIIKVTLEAVIFFTVYIFKIKIRHFIHQTLNHLSLRAKAFTTLRS